ncbi:MAG: hypothetical protein MK212_12165 [Saprospiraceae bacterium]|nr:hypothetical protein [Saprospiraceae bacterium]
MKWILISLVYFLMGNHLYAQDKKIVERQGDATVTYVIGKVNGENCPQIAVIQDDNPSRYSWVSYSPTSCDPMYGSANEAIFQKIKIIKVLESYDCQDHCGACSCPSGTTYYFKLYRDDYEKYKKQLLGFRICE